VTKLLGVLLSNSDRMAIEKLAKINEVSMSDVARILIKRGLESNKTVMNL